MHVDKVSTECICIAPVNTEARITISAVHLNEIFGCKDICCSLCVDSKKAAEV